MAAGGRHASPTPLLHCRCPAELGGPHERPGGCALDRLVYSNANFLAHGNIAENIEKHVRVPMTCEPCSEADPCCSCWMRDVLRGEWCGETGLRRIVIVRPPVEGHVPCEQATQQSLACGAEGWHLRRVHCSDATADAWREESVETCKPEVLNPQIRVT